jgi:hypothetical protein
MIAALNAHDICPLMVLMETTLKHLNLGTDMEMNDKHLFRHKLEYLKLTLMISKLRYHGKEPDIDLLLEAQKLGELAAIPNDELNNLLFNLNIQ